MKKIRFIWIGILFFFLILSNTWAVKLVSGKSPAQSAAPNANEKIANPPEASTASALLSNDSKSEIKKSKTTSKANAKKETIEDSEPKPSDPPEQISPVDKKMDKKGRFVTLDFDGVEMSVFIKFIADITGKNFIIGDNVTGKVTVISPRKMTLGEAYKVFESVLEVNGYSTVSNNGVVKILKTSDAVTKGVETVVGNVGVKQDKLVTQIIQLKHSDSNEMKNLLSPLISKGGAGILSYPQSDILILTDSQSVINRILEILKVVDVPGSTQDFKIIPLQYAAAAEIADKISEMLGGKGGGSSSSSRYGRAVNTGAGEESKIIPYERTNSVIVMSSTSLEQLEKLVKELDIPTPTGKEDVHVYYLQYSNAEDIVKVLSDLPTPASDSAASNAAYSPSRPGSSSKSSGAKGSNYKISADKDTNALIIFADSNTYKNLMNTIKYLDIPRKQVFVRALIMEVKTDTEFKLGVQWQYFTDFKYDKGKKQGGVLFRTGDTNVTTPGDLPGGPLLGVIGQAITINKGGVEVTFPNMASFINAMQTDSDVHVISTPHIIAMDNKEAQLKVGENVPFVTREDTDSTNINRTVRTYDYRDVGVTLKFTPQISQDNNIRMNLFTEISVLKAGAAGSDQFAPTTLKRQAQTYVTVKDDNTMVIGGMIADQLDFSTYKVPLLGDIPLLGWLFKSMDKKRNKSTLYIFINPQVIDSDVEANALYQEKYQEVDALREKFIKQHPEAGKDYSNPRQKFTKPDAPKVNTTNDKLLDPKKDEAVIREEKVDEKPANEKAAGSK